MRSQMSPAQLAQWLIENVNATTNMLKSHVRDAISEQPVKKLPAAYVLEELATTGQLTLASHR